VYELFSGKFSNILPSALPTMLIDVRQYIWAFKYMYVYSKAGKASRYRPGVAQRVPAS
jgi:hypothetical protein